MEKSGTKYKPAYFEEWVDNPDFPNDTYYLYNSQYFEKDRKKLDWSRLPDLYSDKIPAEIEEFFEK